MKYMSIVKPVLKWVGGKTQIIDTLLAHFPSTIQNYHEPFLGGGSVLLGVLSYRESGKLTLSGTIYASDLNSNLIGFYQSIQQFPEQLIAEVRALLEPFSSCADTEVNRSPLTLDQARTSRESYYFWIRSRFNSMTREQRMSPAGSAMFLFLNKTCFRGIYREGPRGFNVPYGNYTNLGIMDEEHIRSVSRLIQGVVFRVQSFMDSLSTVRPGDFVYLDPPYAPETPTSFVGYTVDGFGLEQHEALFTRCHALANSGCSWMMSNADVPVVRENFPEPYSTMVLSCRRSIHAKKPDSKTNEVVITSPSS